MRIVILSLILLAGCSSMPEPGNVVRHVDSQGRVLRVEAPQDVYYVEAERMKSQAECYRAYYANQNGDPTVQALTTAINALSGNKPCDFGRNLNDVAIVKSQESTKKLGMGLGTVKWVAGAWLAESAIDSAFDAASRGGVTVNGSNNEVRGTNTGENGTASYTEQTAPYGGIPVAEGEGTVEYSSGSEEVSESSEEAFACTVLGGTWVEDESRCSDGNNGTIEI